MPPNNALQRVSPNNALLWLEFESQYDVVSATNVVTDGNMEAADASAWLAYTGGSGEKITTNPQAGSKCIRVTCPGYQTGVRQICLTSGVRYRVTGYARGDGTIAPRLFVGGGSTTWDGTTSTTWQPFDLTATADGTALYLVTKTGASGAVDWDSISVQPYTRVVRNYGKYPGAPATCQLGDGTTASTFPTQLVGRHGCSFDGGDYIDTGIIDPFERTDKFSLFVATSSISVSCDVISSADAANSIRGIAISHRTTNGVVAYIINNYSGNNLISTSLSSIPVRSLITDCVTYSGNSLASGVNMYINGTIVQKTIVNDTLNGTIKSGKSFLIGMRHNGASFLEPMTGNIYHASIWPYELTPQQVAYLDRLCKQRINRA